MNSRQRRRTRRYWRYEFVCSEDISYEKYLDNLDWLKKNLGKVGYRWGHYSMTCDFEFRHERDYLLFLLYCT
jgi:hypothetical protein